MTLPSSASCHIHSANREGSKEPGPHVKVTICDGGGRGCGRQTVGGGVCLNFSSLLAVLWEFARHTFLSCILGTRSWPGFVPEIPSLASPTDFAELARSCRRRLSSLLFRV